jgi:hypothetical protein
VFEGWHRTWVAKQFHVIGAEELRNCEEKPNPCVVEDVCGFRTFESSVQRNEGCTASMDRAGCDDPFGNVLRPNCDAIPGLDRESDESVCSFVDLLEKFSKIQSQITVDKGLSLAEEFGGTFERLSDSGG